MNREHLLKVMLDQKQEQEQYLQRAIPRLFDKNVEKSQNLLKRGLVTVITGVRRSGKSTYALQLAHAQKNHGSVVAINFDDERLIGFSPNDFDLFLQVAYETVSDPKIFIFDELQNIAGWELFINRLLRKDVLIIITGSNAKLLSQELATHLTGRTLTFTLFPLSFREFWVVKNQEVPREHLLPQQLARGQKLFNEYFATGGFPEIILGSLKNEPSLAQVYLRELFDRILTRDIMTRYRLRDAQGLKEVAIWALSQSGQLMTYHKTAKNLEIKSVSLVKKYFDFISEVYLTFLVANYSTKVKEIIKSPRKIYTIDLGLLDALTLKATPDWGGKLETFVFLELKRRGLEFFMLRDAQLEVDFVIREGRTLTDLVQVCYDMSAPQTYHRELEALKKASQLYSINRLWILTYDHEELIKLDAQRTIKVLPCWKWALI